MEASERDVHMQSAEADLRHVHRKLIRSIESFKKLDLGSYHGEPDRPHKLFDPVLYEVVRSPIRDRQHLDALFLAIEYLMAEEPNPTTVTIDQAIDDILLQAINKSEPREQALLALVRYRLSGPRRELMNA